MACGKTKKTGKIAKRSKQVGLAKRIDMSIESTKASEKKFIKPDLRIGDITKLPTIKKSKVYNLDNIDELGDTGEFSEKYGVASNDWLALRKQEQLNAKKIATSKRRRSRKAYRVSGGKTSKRLFGMDPISGEVGILTRIGEAVGSGAKAVGRAAGHAAVVAGTRIVENAGKEIDYQRQQGRLDSLAHKLGAVRDTRNPNRYWLNANQYIDVPEGTPGEIMLRDAVESIKESSYGKIQNARFSSPMYRRSRW